MSRSKKSNVADYSLLMNNLYTALYERNNNPFTGCGSIFKYKEKLKKDPLNGLVNQIRKEKESPFMKQSDYRKILDLYSKTSFSVSGNQKIFFIAHLGGWKSGRVVLSDKINPIFNDNNREDGGVRDEFYNDIMSWKCTTDSGNNYSFFHKNESIGMALSMKTNGISEYIVACNYYLIQEYCNNKELLRQILDDFVCKMYDAEYERYKTGFKSLFNSRQEEMKRLCKCLNILLVAYDKTNDEREKDWLLARTLAWLVIAAMLRNELSSQLIKNHLEEHLPPEDTTGEGEEHVRTKEEAAKTNTIKNGQDDSNTGLSTPELFWAAGKNWYEEARKPGARFHSLDIIDHILPSAKDTPPEAGFELSFPFRAADTDEHTIQCSRFSELLMDKDSIYHQGHYILIGEGGIGKTTTLMSAMVDAYDGKRSYSGESVIPLFIELSLAPDSQDSHAYDGTSSSVVHRLIYSMLQQNSRRNDRSDILRECMNDESNIAKDTVHELISTVNDEGIKFALLIDGLNEVSGEPFTGHRSSSAQGRILQEIIGLADEYQNVTVILTSRNRVLVDRPSFHSFYLRGLVWEDIEKYLQEKEKTEKEISAVRNGDKGLLEVLSIPMFLTMYARLQDTEGITTRGELMKFFFHERLERRKEEYGIYRQGDIAERIDRDEEQAVRGRMERGNITLPMQWLFLDVLIPEIAAKMEEAEALQITGKEKNEIQAFRISRKGVRSILEFLFKDRDSLYCGRYKEFSNSCFERQLQGKDLEDVISEFTGSYKQRAAEYTDAFLTYCESSIGILFKEGEKSYGFIHQHFRDYFAAVCIINRMKTAYTAYQEKEVALAREILQEYGEAPLNPLLMVNIGEYLGEPHNNPALNMDQEGLPVDSALGDHLFDRHLISYLLDIYRGVDLTDDYSIYNLIEVLRRVRKDLSGADLHRLDLRKCRFYDVHMDTKHGINFSMALIDAGRWFAEGHAGCVNFACFSPDGTKIVTVSDDKTAIVWDANTGSLLHTLEGHTDRVSSANFSPDGNRIVTVSVWTVKVWDANTGAILHTLKGHAGWVNTVSFSPDGSKIVTAYEDSSSIVWDTDTGSLLCTLEGHADCVNSASFSPDGTKIVTASDDSSVKIWDADTGSLLHTLDWQTNRVYSAYFSPDGSRIITASQDRTAKVWDSGTGSLLHTLEGHADWISSISFSPNGASIITISDDSSAKVWDTNTGALLSTIKDKIYSAHFSSDGSRIVTTSSDWICWTAKVWDSGTGLLLHTLKGHADCVNSASFNPDGSRIVTASNDRTAKVWDIGTESLLFTLGGHASIVNSASFSSDGTKIVTTSDDGTAKVWDIGTGLLLETLEGHVFTVNSASFSPDGTKIVTASDDWTAKVWDIGTGLLLETLEGHVSSVNSACFSPDGTRVVTTSDDWTAKIWDTGTVSLLHTLKGHAFKINSASFSPDGTKIVTASDDGSAKIWDADTGSLLHTLKGYAYTVDSACFSLDGAKIIMVSDNDSATVWDVGTGTLLQTLEVYTGGISTSFSPDGTKIVTTHKKMAKVWDSGTGSLLHTLDGHAGWVSSACFSPDGARIVTTCDNAAKVWDVNTGKLLQTYYEVSGLFIMGVDFKSINSMSAITDKHREVFKQYGAII